MERSVSTYGLFQEYILTKSRNRRHCTWLGALAQYRHTSNAEQRPKTIETVGLYDRMQLKAARRNTPTEVVTLRDAFQMLRVQPLPVRNEDPHRGSSTLGLEVKLIHGRED